MKTTAFVILALSVGNAFSAVLQARAPEAESMQVAPRAEVSDIDTGLSVMQADTRKLTDITSSDLAQRSNDGTLEKRWSEACMRCLAACLAGAGLANWRAGVTYITRFFLPSFAVCRLDCIASGACVGPSTYPSVLSEPAQILNEQKRLGLTDPIGGSSPVGSPGH